MQKLVVLFYFVFKRFNNYDEGEFANFELVASLTHQINKRFILNQKIRKLKNLIETSERAKRVKDPSEDKVGR